MVLVVAAQCDRRDSVVQASLSTSVKQLENSNLPGEFTVKLQDSLIRAPPLLCYSAQFRDITVGLLGHFCAY